jgi:hypothetical protein
MEKQYNIEDGKALIEKYLKSGMSGAKFCKQNGISYNKMVYWRKKLGHGRKPKTTLTQTKQTESEWAKLEMNPKSHNHSTAKPVAAYIHSGIVVRIGDISVEISPGSTKSDIDQVLKVVHGL